MKTFENKKIIVTGHTGFKGSWLTAWLKILGADIVGILLIHPLQFLIMILQILQMELKIIV